MKNDQITPHPSGADLGFIHRYEPAELQANPGNGTTLLLLHGTGGDEWDLLPLGRSLAPQANLLSPRGKVLENGMPRFFRRLAEGVFDEEDLIQRTHELADFIQDAASHYGFDVQKVVALGYSNGANIAASLMLLRPEILKGAVLLRAMVPLVPATLPDLKGRSVFIATGEMDSMIPISNATRLESMLRGAGAEVEWFRTPAGHPLTSADLSAAAKWLAAQPSGK